MTEIKGVKPDPDEVIAQAMTKLGEAPIRQAVEKLDQESGVYIETPQEVIARLVGPDNRVDTGNPGNLPRRVRGGAISHALAENSLRARRTQDTRNVEFGGGIDFSPKR